MTPSVFDTAAIWRAAAPDALVAHGRTIMPPEIGVAGNLRRTHEG
ncbi:hypothetical protein [Streptomyces vulcanius]|uniref:Uncharacterized protein n=2 Tax=Streptomyces TaxID=1883 RepID=A0ABV9JA06_9ACTN